MSEEKSIQPFFLNETAKALLDYAQEQYDSGKQQVHLINDDEDANEFLNPCGQYPHAFVLACIMDIQVKAQNAWIIPQNVKKIIHSFDMKTLSRLSEEDIYAVFSNMDKIHRFPTRMAKRFFCAVQKIHNDYNDDASKIWADNPPSGIVVSRFLQFEGAGIKIATMATNILVRQYMIQLKDKHCIDISPDTHIVRVFQRLGLISEDNLINDKKEKDNKAKNKAMYMARMINPDYPGILDYPCWDVGKNHCHARTPECNDCPFSHFCPSNKGNR